MQRSRFAVIPRGPTKVLNILFNTFKFLHTWAFFLRDGLDGVHEVVSGLIGTIVSPAPQL